MNAYRKLTLAALAATSLAVLTPSARAQTLQDRELVTFSAPVEIPGKVLPAGTYIFEALEADHVTRILSADQHHVYATIVTLPDETKQSVEKGNVVLSEGTKGAPERVESWFLPGNAIGNEFIYHKAASKKSLGSVGDAFIKDSGAAVKKTARDIGVSSEFVGVHAEHVVVNSGEALAHAVKYLVS